MAIARRSCRAALTFALTIAVASTARVIAAADAPRARVDAVAVTPNAIRVPIDSYHDRRTAYEFAVNPAGVKQDRYWYNDNSRDDSWDAVWDVKVSRDESGWVAEFRIPFSQLRFTPNRENTFGFAVARQIGRLNETCTWPLLARSANGYVSSFGDLGGLSMTASPKRMELVPYTVGNL